MTTIKKKILTVLLIAFFFLFAGASAHTTIGGHPPCSVCGDGRVVTNPNGVVIIEDETLSCELYEEYGEEGFFDLIICKTANVFAGDCGCRRKRSAGRVAGIVIGALAALVVVICAIVGGISACN